MKHAISKVVPTEGKKLHLRTLFWLIAELSVVETDTIRIRNFLRQAIAESGVLL